jgi:hypothetical protein
MRREKTLLEAVYSGKLTDQHFHLRKNGKFDCREKLLSLSKIDYYAGTYTVVNDTIHLQFLKDHRPAWARDKAVITPGYFILLSEDTIYNTYMSIRKNTMEKK